MASELFPESALKQKASRQSQIPRDQPVSPLERWASLPSLLPGCPPAAAAPRAHVHMPGSHEGQGFPRCAASGTLTPSQTIEDPEE